MRVPRGGARYEERAPRQEPAIDRLLVEFRATTPPGRVRGLNVDEHHAATGSVPTVKFEIGGISGRHVPYWWKTHGSLPLVCGRMQRLVRVIGSLRRLTKRSVMTSALCVMCRVWARRYRAGANDVTRQGTIIVRGVDGGGARDLRPCRRCSVVVRPLGNGRAPSASKSVQALRARCRMGGDYAVGLPSDASLVPGASSTRETGRAFPVVLNSIPSPSQSRRAVSVGLPGQRPSMLRDRQRRPSPRR